ITSSSLVGATKTFLQTSSTRSLILMKKSTLMVYLRHFLILNIITWALIGSSIPFAFDGHPKFKYTDTDWDDFNYVPEYNHSSWNVLLDPHSHTFVSDGFLTPRQNILWHISMGFNAMVLTDHNTFENVEEIRQIARDEYNDTIKVFAGLEWTTDRIHMNIILPPNVTKAQYETLITFRSYAYTPSNEEMQDFIQSQDYTSDHPTRQELFDWGIDYIEIVNGNEYDNESYYFCLDNGVGMITGTDMHAPDEVYCWTTLNATEFTEEAIFTEIKARNTGFIFTGISSSYPIEHPLNPSYVALFPLIKLGEFFDSMYSSGAFGAAFGTFLGYIYGIFIVVEALLFLIRKLAILIKEKELLKIKKKN
ncbi:MAG: PHP domain-containing protein, partial [Candidatus Heimdallarchaeaceae archaeon]